MVNQDPQPEVFETDFIAVDISGATTTTNQIYTNQGHAEQVFIYAIGVDVVSNADGTDADFYDFDITITAGANNVPTNAFDGGWIYNSADRMVSLSCPIVVNFKQPLQVSITFPTGGSGTYDFHIQLIGETAIIKR